MINSNKNLSGRKSKTCRVEEGLLRVETRQVESVWEPHSGHPSMRFSPFVEKRSG